jgi:hypothetical protein
MKSIWGSFLCQLSRSGRSETLYLFWSDAPSTLLPASFDAPSNPTWTLYRRRTICTVNLLMDAPPTPSTLGLIIDTLYTTNALSIHTFYYYYVDALHLCFPYPYEIFPPLSLHPYPCLMSLLLSEEARTPTRFAFFLYELVYFLFYTLVFRIIHHKIKLPPFMSSEFPNQDVT